MAEPSLFWPLFFAILVIAAVWWLFLRLWRERPGGPEDDSGWDWRRWDGPDDWPKLPPAPKGGGSPDFVPDEWVWEEFGKPPQLSRRPLPPAEEVPSWRYR